MRRETRILLVFLTLLPVYVLFLYEFRYTAAENSWCKRYSDFSYNCDYSERFERDRILHTNFYRHLGYYLGRDEGTSSSFINAVNMCYYDCADQSEAWEAIMRFNREFLVVFLASVAIAGSASTLLAQDLLRLRRARVKGYEVPSKSRRA